MQEQIEAGLTYGEKLAGASNQYSEKDLLEAEKFIRSTFAKLFDLEWNWRQRSLAPLSKDFLQDAEKHLVLAQMLFMKSLTWQY